MTQLFRNFAINRWLPYVGANDGEAEETLRSAARLAARIVSFRDLESLLRAFGFEHDRTTGSHRHYVHPSVAQVMSLQPDGKDA